MSQNEEVEEWIDPDECMSDCEADGGDPCDCCVTCDAPCDEICGDPPEEDWWEWIE
jgi:hypothetical protein